ncbi:MAG: hypothetical protein CMO81_09785 [Waddliaceae bacterium]|nr:hypothetical protein [Waddliaceae bacterium]
MLPITENSILQCRQSALLVDDSLLNNQEFVEIAEKLKIYLHDLDLNWTRDLGFILHNRFFYSPHKLRCPQYDFKAISLSPEHKHNFWLSPESQLGASLHASESIFFLRSQQKHPTIAPQEIVSHVEGGNMLSTGSTLILGSDSAFVSALRLLADQGPHLCEGVRDTIKVISQREDWNEAVQIASNRIEKYQLKSINDQLSDFAYKAELESYGIPAVLTALVEFAKIEAAAEFRQVMGHEQVLWTPNELGLKARQMQYHLDLYMANIAFNTVILDNPKEVISSCNDALQKISQFTPICSEKLNNYKHLVHDTLINHNVNSQKELSRLYDIAISSEEPFTKEITTICRSQAIAEVFDLYLKDDYEKIKKDLNNAGVKVITIPGNWYDLDHDDFTVTHTHCFINGITDQATSTWLTFRYDDQENFRHQAFTAKIADYVKNTFYIEGGSDELLFGGGLRCMTLPFEINPHYLPQTE